MWHRNSRNEGSDAPSEPSYDFMNSDQERGVKEYINWPVLGALIVALLVLGILFLLR